MRVLIVSALLFCWIATSVLAHDPGISTGQGELKHDVLSLTTGFAPADAQYLLPPESRGEETWTSETFDGVRGQLLAAAPRLWEVRSGATLLTPRNLTVDLLPGDNVSFHVEFTRASGENTLVLRALKLGELPAGHRQFVIVSDERGSVITKKLLKAEDSTLAVIAGEPEPDQNGTTAWEFTRLGVEHIWEGYDHLLFLFALLLVCRSFRSIVGIVSCFTLAHSLTLALATLNLVSLPSRLVEVAIAASIVFVGAENLVRRGEEPRGRWALTFGFGLVHGFGFASVLRDLGVGANADGIGVPLFTFNLGVELGQIAIACIVLPVVWRLRKWEWFATKGVPILSGLIALIGLYWVLERTILA